MVNAGTNGQSHDAYMEIKLHPHMPNHSMICIHCEY